MVKIRIKYLVCLRCNHKWIPRTNDIRVCPKCRSHYWDKPRKKDIRTFLEEAYKKEEITKKETKEKDIKVEEMIAKNPFDDEKEEEAKDYITCHHRQVINGNNICYYKDNLEFKYEFCKDCWKDKTIWKDEKKPKPGIIPPSSEIKTLEIKI